MNVFSGIADSDARTKTDRSASARSGLALRTITTAQRRSPTSGPPRSESPTSDLGPKFMAPFLIGSIRGAAWLEATSSRTPAIGLVSAGSREWIDKRRVISGHTEEHAIGFRRSLSGQLLLEKNRSLEDAGDRRTGEPLV